jgi:hypothetical protein
MTLRPTKGHEDASWRTRSCVLRRDSSRRRADIETGLDAARKSACATGRLQRSRCRFGSGFAGLARGAIRRERKKAHRVDHAQNALLTQGANQYIEALVS